MKEYVIPVTEIYLIQVPYFFGYKEFLPSKTIQKI